MVRSGDPEERHAFPATLEAATWRPRRLSTFRCALLEHLGLVELEHKPRNNRIRAR